MKKDSTELVFILDRSGSMQGLEMDTIGGFNAMLEKQRGQKGEANITTVLFDDKYEKIHDRCPLKQVKGLTDREYYVRGTTALLDAVGRTIHEMELIQKHLPDEKKAEKVVFVITTDGLENSSYVYSKKQIRKMIQQKKERCGWEFFFLGANMDAVAEAEGFGIGAERAVTFQNDSQGIETNYRVVSETISQIRCAASAGDFVGADWKKEIEEDFKKRNRKKWKK